MFFPPLLCFKNNNALSLLLAQVSKAVCILDNGLHNIIIIFRPNSGLTFGQTKLLQLTGQRLTVNVMFCCTGENEAEHCHASFDVSSLCKMGVMSWVHFIWHKIQCKHENVHGSGIESLQFELTRVIVLMTWILTRKVKTCDLPVFNVCFLGWLSVFHWVTKNLDKITCVKRLVRG